MGVIRYKRCYNKKGLLSLTWLRTTFRLTLWGQEMLYDFLQHLHQLGPQYLISPCCISYLCLLRSPYLLFHSISTDFDPVSTLMQATWVNMIHLSQWSHLLCQWLDTGKWSSSGQNVFLLRNNRLFSFTGHCWFMHDTQNDGRHLCSRVLLTQRKCCEWQAGKDGRKLRFLIYLNSTNPF